ncbi:hypothetical protein U1Q18_023259 [Sarracenia purpurea var. burkii]
MIGSTETSLARGGEAQQRRRGRGRDPTTTVGGATYNVPPSHWRRPWRRKNGAKNRGTGGIKYVDVESATVRDFGSIRFNFLPPR